MKWVKLCFFVTFEVLFTAVSAGIVGLTLDMIWGKQNLAEAAPTFVYMLLLILTAGFCPLGLAALGAVQTRRPWVRRAWGLAGLLATIGVVATYAGFGTALHLAFLTGVVVVGMLGWELFSRWWLD